jgi:hypothetical protein
MEFVLVCGGRCFQFLAQLCFSGKIKKEAIKAVVDHLILSTVGKQHIFQSHPSCQRNTFLPL